jgi:signal recognition particle subunit SRP68
MDEIEPMLRFCAYKLGKDTSKGVNVIARQVADDKLSTVVRGWDELKTRLEEEGSVEQKEQVEVRWRGEIVPVRNVELVDAAVKVQQVLASLEKDDSGAKKGGEGSAGKRKAEGKKETLGARRMGTYDKALLVLGEAEQVASQLVEDNKVSLTYAHEALFSLGLLTLSRSLTRSHSRKVNQLDLKRHLDLSSSSTLTFNITSSPSGRSEISS